MNLVLNYRPKHAHEHDWSERVYLVWPAAVWRVVAPLTANRRINILQKAVLGVCRSASYPVNEIAAKLHLHPRLIEEIGRELVGFDWLDQANGRPTSKGLAVLEEDESAAESLISGWVFQDPFTGDLWPHFARQLQLQEVEPVPNRCRVALLLDTAKGVRKPYAWAPDPPPPPAQPTAEAILAAVRHSHHREKLKDSMHLIDSDVGEASTEISPDVFSRVTFISDTPEMVGLVTYAYLADAGELEPQICDPFGFGCAPSMWRQLQSMVEEDEAATCAVRVLLERVNAKYGPTWGDNIRFQREAAEAYILEKLSLNAKKFPAVFAHLVDVQRYLVLAQAAGDADQGLLAPVMASCRKTLEALLKEVAWMSPLTNADQLLTGDRKLDRATVQKIASDLGFAEPLPQKLQDSIQPKGTPQDTKRRVAQIARNLKNVFSLSPAMIATILASSADAAHPLRQAAKRAPDLLEKFVAIQDSGNPAAHDNSHERVPNLLTVPEATCIRDLTLEVTACLLNLTFNDN